MSNQQAIKDAINSIWGKYDVDGNGSLDKNETRLFVKETLESLGMDGDLSDEAYDGVFSVFDRDGNGSVSKNEME